jgi:hypothetical protein
LNMLIYFSQEWRSAKTIAKSAARRDASLGASKARGFWLIATGASHR